MEVRFRRTFHALRQASVHRIVKRHGESPGFKALTNQPPSTTLNNVLSLPLTSEQRAVIEAGLASRNFLRGPVGTGKSTVGAGRLELLLRRGVPGDSILVLTPQRTLQTPYLGILRSPARPAGGEVALVTLAGLARRMCDLFWPLAAERAGFAHPDRPPVFLTLETSQYYMAHIVRPRLADGYFESLTIDRNRLYAQILDNLNKAAAVGFPHTEIGARLDAAWAGDPERRRVYADVQECANRFRQFCLQHNLLDFSLQLEVFWHALWPEPAVRDYLTRTYRHLIYDNVEEDVPRAHDLIRAWLPEFDSALLIYDEEGGQRRFLGADAQSALALSALCERAFRFEHSFVMPEGIAWLSHALARAIRLEPAPRPPRRAPLPLEIISARFYPELLDRVVERIQSLMADSGLPPHEVVILSPYLSDSLRFAITSRLDARHIPWRSHRPSRPLRDEPAVRALLTLAALAHPHWNIHPSTFDVAQALRLVLEVDLVRAQLLSEIVYRARDLTLSAFEQIQPQTRARITSLVGERYTRLRAWLLDYRSAPPLPLDIFLRRLFGQQLSQAGFGFHRNPDAARAAAALIESMRKFRLAIEPASLHLDHPDFDFGKEYVAMLQEGVIAAQYLEAWSVEREEAVLVAPAYTFLMMNRPVRVQIWLDPGSGGWYTRPDQPLTHAHVLSRAWPPGRLWTFADEEQANREGLARLASGLLHRCREKLYLGLSNLGESGFEQRGELLRAFQKVLPPLP